MCLDHYSRLSWWAEQHWSPHKCKKCKWGIVGETSDRKPIFSVLLWPYRDIPSLLMQQFPAFAYGVLQATTITLVTQELYYEWKKVDQTPSCWSNRVMTVMLFKTSSLILQMILFIRTVPTIIFQPVEFLLRHHLQKLSHFWLYWIQLQEKALGCKVRQKSLVQSWWHTCSKTSSSLCSRMQTHLCTTSKPDNLPRSPPSKDRIIKIMILCTNSISHPIICERRTLERIFEMPTGASPLPLLMLWHSWGVTGTICLHAAGPFASCGAQ